MFLNHIIHVIQNPDDAIWPVRQLSELPAASSMELWTREPNVGIQFEANFTNSLVIASLGSIKRGLQMITHNAIGFLHPFSNCFGIFVRILICWFRFVKEQVNFNSWLSEENQVEWTERGGTMLRSVVGETNILGLLMPVSLMFFDGFCKYSIDCSMSSFDRCVCDRPISFGDLEFPSFWIGAAESSLQTPTHYHDLQLAGAIDQVDMFQ